jgi:hypothetical protein
LWGGHFCWQVEQSDLSGLWRGSVEGDTERDLLLGVSNLTAKKKNRGSLAREAGLKSGGSTSRGVETSAGPRLRVCLGISGDSAVPGADRRRLDGPRSRCSGKLSLL